MCGWCVPRVGANLADIAAAHAVLLLACLLQVSCGFERTIASNFFGHFWLTQLLLDDLKAAAPSRCGRSPAGGAPGPGSQRQQHQRSALRHTINWLQAA